MTRTFLDSGVLLTAWRGKELDAQKAAAVIEDLEREFVSCQMVRLELLPKPAYQKNRDEMEFYEANFGRVTSEEPFSADLGNEALALARRYGLAAADALNIAAAIRMGASEFVTSELPGKPMFRVKEIAVKTLFQA
jgi:predicted nucleic acid-binding protein